MGATAVFLMGAMGTLGVGIGVICYLRQPLQSILVELCGNQERAGFWTAFSAVTLGLVPAIFALGWRPEAGSPAVFELADQLKWGLLGLVSTLVVLGMVIGRTIRRFENRETPKVNS